MISESESEVVLYLTSTSNHNLCTIVVIVSLVVLYLTSTSNHNYANAIS